MLKNQSGKFVLADAETISAGASVLDPRTPADERLSLVFASGGKSIPLINYEYVLVSKRQPDPRPLPRFATFCSGRYRTRAATRPNISTPLVLSHYRISSER